MLSSPLPHTCHFVTRSSHLSNIGGNAWVHIFCSSTAKTSTVTPTFYFVILIRAVLPFHEKKKIGINLCSVFWQI